MNRFSDTWHSASSGALQGHFRYAESRRFTASSQKTLETGRLTTHPPPYVHAEPTFRQTADIINNSNHSKQLNVKAIHQTLSSHFQTLCAFSLSSTMYMCNHCMCNQHQSIFAQPSWSQSESESHTTSVSRHLPLSHTDQVLWCGPAWTANGFSMLRVYASLGGGVRPRSHNEVSQ